MKHFIRLNDLNIQDVQAIFRLADEFRAGKHRGCLQDGTIALFFPESSIRTRITYERGIYLMGGQSVLFPPSSLDKKEDVVTLRNLGASDKQIARIFMLEGRMISLIGAVAGVLFGLLLCWLQQEYGFVRLGSSSGSFVVDAYPVSVHYTDVAIVFFTVIAVGWIAVWYPVRYMSNRLLQK